MHEPGLLPLTIYGVPLVEYPYSPKYIKRWADMMGVSVNEYLEIREAEINYEYKNCRG